MGPSRRTQWSEWSDWIWDDANGRAWRARQDAQGNVEYDYNFPDAAGQAGETAPRGGVEDLADAFSTVNLSGQDAAYTQDGAYTYTTPVAVAAAGHEGSAAAYGTLPGKSKGRSAEQPAKSKSRAPKDKASLPRKHRSKPGRSHGEGYGGDPAAASIDHDPFYPKPGGPSGFDYASRPDAAFIDPQEAPDPRLGTSTHGPAFGSGLPQSPRADRDYDQSPPLNHRDEAEFPNQGQYGRRSHPSGRGTRHPASGSDDLPPANHREEDEYPDQGHYRRRSHASGRGSRLPTAHPEDPLPEQPASDYYTTAPDSFAQGESDEQLQAALSQANPYHTGAPDASYPDEGSPSMAAARTFSYEPSYGLDSGQRTPTQSAQPGIEAVDNYQYQANALARPSIGREPDMHDGYVVEHSTRFKPGEVFKILWCEPLGAGTPRSEVITNFVGMQERNGQQFYQGFRRFIVVANDEGNCTCVPILTYEHKACTKKGVKPAKHGIAYQVGKRPRPVEGEPTLGFPPVRINLYEKTEQLNKESRINYAKLSTIEHNFRVFFIGSVLPEDFVNIVGPAVDECWRRKRRHNH